MDGAPSTARLGVLICPDVAAGGDLRANLMENAGCAENPLLIKRTHVAG